MKIAVISDIHGNHYALCDVLREAREVGVEKLLILGDLVGYYYHPDKVLELLSDWDYEIIGGNHESLLKKLLDGTINAEKVQAKYGKGHAIALEKLRLEQISFLINLPFQKSVCFDGVSFLLNHGSPWDPDHYLYPDSEDLELCDSASHDFVLVGHSHYPFTFQGPNSVLINCGSVGQSRSQGGSAAWACIETEGKKFELKETKYNVHDLITEVEAIDPEILYNKEVLTRK